MAGFLAFLGLLLGPGVSSHEVLDLDLGKAVRLAMEKNLEIVNSMLDVEASGAEERSALGRFLPSLSMGISQSIHDRSRMVLSGTRGLVKTNRSYSLNLGLNYNIFNGFKDISSLKAAKLLREASELTYERTKEEVALIVVQRYLACLKAEKLVDIARQAMERSKVQLERTELMFKLGSVPQADVIKQRVQFGREKLKLLQAKMEYQSSLAELLYVLGVEAEGRRVRLEDVQELGGNVEMDFEEAFRTALERRKDILALKKALEAARYELKAAKGALLPTIDASVSYGFWDVSLPRSFRDIDRTDNISFGIALRVPIFQRLQARSAVAEAEINLRKLENQLKDVERKVALEIRTRLMELKMSKENIELARENLRAAEEDLRLAEERYRLGAGILLDRIMASLQRREAEADYVDARYSYILSKVRLEGAMGMLELPGLQGRR
ncbi:MAG: hypothetical protein DRP94_07595 [Candidatus Latescibacterota bacterium]|nr:MAG: hypothetical protein DRP94_07595 [Candidatus Latescibacterota bacterium]RKY73856.1 MAG: hypothetical protein DRQ14_03295 [Candidatus Latescibacterota bacterium]